MSDKNIEINSQSQEEKQVWNKIMDWIVVTAKSAKTLDFGKFKLQYMLLLDEVSDKSQALPDARLSKESISRKFDILNEKKDAFQQHYSSFSKEIDEMRKQYIDKPRTLIMLEPAQEKLDEFLAYVTNKPPTFPQLNNKIKSIEENVIHVDKHQDEPSQNISQ